VTDDTDAGPAGLAERATAAAERIAPTAVVESIRSLPGGHSSLTYSAVLKLGGEDDRQIVLKVAPPGVAPTDNRDVLRQARVIRALAGASGVMVPEILFESEGEPPEVPPLFAMAYVEGDSTEPRVESTEVPGRILADRALAASRMLAALHAVDLGSVGLDHEPHTGLGAEVERWGRSFEAVEDDLRFDGPVIALRLLETVPRPSPAVLVHGDYRLGNLRCEGSAIRAVLDWEIWSVGDGRMDLAWFLLMLDAGYVQRSVEVEALPTVEALQREYESTSGRAVDGMGWFHAFARFKQAAATALITKRARRHGGEGFPDTIANLLAAATSRLDDPA
jgi:aminoglycoside phosphotransferase (APT) family kinase protein